MCKEKTPIEALDDLRPETLRNLAIAIQPNHTVGQVAGRSSCSFEGKLSDLQISEVDRSLRSRGFKGIIGVIG